MTDIEGRFVFTGLAGNEATVTFPSLNVTCSAKLHIAGDQVMFATLNYRSETSYKSCTVDAMNMQPGQPAQISGVVAWRESNAPYVRRVVTIRSPGNEIREITTDRRGYFSALGLPLGRTFLWTKDCYAQLDLVSGEDVRAVALPYSYNSLGMGPRCEGWHVFMVAPLFPLPPGSDRGFIPGRP